jgi:MFS family permease
LNVRSDPPTSQSDPARAFIVAWVFSLAFYFLEYAVRSSPAVMIPELAKAFNVSALEVSGILGTYYYTYSTASLVAGVLLDRLGAKYIVPAGMAILGLGCLVFVLPQEGMGTLGRLLQIVVGKWIAGGVAVTEFWSATGVVVLLVAVGLMWITPKEPRSSHAKASGGVLSTYKIVFSNPQSYLCGLAAGLLFVPTTVGDMVWGVRFFQADKLFSFTDAVFAISMVPFGWVFGCPLLGWLADRFGRRKPVYLGGAAVMLIGFVQLIYFPALLPAWLTLLILGIASGAAMIPYTIIKEVNPDEVKGSATGAINFLTFGVTAVIGPVFAGQFGKTLGAENTDPVAHFQHAGLFWVIVLIAALLVGSVLKETGRRNVIQSADLAGLPRGTLQK